MKLAAEPNGYLRWAQEFEAAVAELHAREERLSRHVQELQETCRDASQCLLRYRELFEFAPDCYLVTDLRGVIQEANHAASLLFRRRREFLLGKPLAFFVAAEQRSDFYVWLVRFGRLCGTMHEWEVRFGPCRNEQVDASLTVTVTSDAEGRPVGLRWLIRDVSRRKRAEAALAQAQRQAVQYERLAAIGQMSAGLAHESRNALQRSHACLELLAWKLEGRPEVADLLVRAKQAQEELLRLYENVREYAAPIRLNCAPCNLADVWRQAWSDQLPLQPKRSLGLHEQTDSADLACVADAFRLRQVFRNLLENALAACAGPVRVEVRCQEAEVEGRPALRVALRDSGPGLDAEQRQRLFEPFYTTRTRGTGLGLAIAKRLVEAHGGRIFIGDHAGPGAEIVILLPRSCQ
jgi:PAS domain S-box-containing protein